MSRARRGKLEPWIEQTILNYSTEEETKHGRLRAHAVGVGHMSASQALEAAGPTVVIFLSDGVVQIPAVLTQDAWETVQETEDRECCYNLTNCTVCVYAYSLQFHLVPEMTRCRFFLSISELSTTAAGPPKDSTPCCTTLSSVRDKICETWRSRIATDSVHSQNELGLSELLGAWMDDRIEQLKESVRELLKVPCTRTQWAEDRIRYKENVSVPTAHLNAPEEEHLLVQTPSDQGSDTPSGLVPPSEDNQTDLPLPATHTETAQSVSDESNGQADKPALQERLGVHGITLAGEIIDGEMVPKGSTGAGVSPWDMFAPAVDMLSTSSSSDVSMTPEPLPLEESQSLLEPTPLLPAPLRAATSTPVPSQKSGVSERSDDCSLPPYQRPHPSYSPVPVNGSPSSGSPAIWPLGSGTGDPGNPTPTPPLHTPTELQAQDEKQGGARAAKRSPEVAFPLEEEEEEGRQADASLPSWLLESPLAPKRREEGRCCEPRPATAARNAANVHSDGTSFSYSYQTSDKILQDLCQIKIPDLLLRWALKYLVSDPRVGKETLSGTESGGERE